MKLLCLVTQLCIFMTILERVSYSCNPRYCKYLLQSSPGFNFKCYLQYQETAGRDRLFYRNYEPVFIATYVMNI